MTLSIPPRPVSRFPGLNVACFLSQHGVHEGGEMPPCDGRLVRVHLIPRQLLRREFPEGVVIELPEAVTPAGRVRESTQFTSWSAIADDRRTWVLACGGPMGNGGHHGMLDYSRTIRVPREAIPPWMERFAAQLDLTWWLDREYGAR